jgi:hypothetical protein
MSSEVMPVRQEMRVSTLGLNSDEENDSNTCEDIYSDKYEKNNEDDSHLPAGVANQMNPDGL